MQPMRLGKREIKESEGLRQILEECKVMRLGLTDADGMFIVPVNFGYDFETENGQRKLRLYFHSAQKGRKARVLSLEGQAAVEMDCGHALIRGDYTCGYSYGYRSIMGTAKIRKVTETEEKIYCLTRLMEHLEPGTEICFLPEMLEKADVYCAEVMEFTGKERKLKKQML